MDIIKTIHRMTGSSEGLRYNGKKIGFVPTMGYLHDGHLSLIKEARKQNDILIVSIYVNPIQFAAGEDCNTYPKDFDRDIKLLEASDTDILFFPDDREIFPEGYKTYIYVEEITEKLCGISRPGHFRGVATIVAKLFNIIGPHTAYFGEKDFQQLAVIRRMVMDLNFDVRIIGMPIIREKDGLAMSSRNRYLNTAQRKAALCLFKAIVKANDLVREGVLSSEKILHEARHIIESENMTKIDYLVICDPQKFKDVDIISDNTLFALAVKVGETRLIDNCILNLQQ